MARPSKALLKFVQLYCNGPEYLRGDWDRCVLASGLKEGPDTNDPMVRRMIAEATPEPEQEPAPATEADEPAAVDALAGLEIAQSAGIPWTQLKQRLTMVIEGVASGSVKATAAQVSMIKEILAQSKEEAAASQRGVRGVILLPTQGAGEATRLDTQMREQIRALEATPESGKATD